MLFAQNASFNELSGRWSLHDITALLEGQTLPVTFKGWIYAHVSAPAGNYDVALYYRNIDGAWASKPVPLGMFDFDNNTDIQMIAFGVTLQFPEYGMYEVWFSFDGYDLAPQRLEVRRVR